MLTHRIHGSGNVTLVFLHWLGGTSDSWLAITEQLDAYDVRSIAIDLPGFGNAALTLAKDVVSMAVMVEETIAALLRPSEQYVLVGHSMGGKVAAVLARRAADRAAVSCRPRALMLISPSPPAPEPMQESKRMEVTRELGSNTAEESSRAAFAHAFIKQNVGKLPPEPGRVEGEAERMFRSAPEAFRLWMQEFSRQDLSSFVGTLALPTLILAGTDDEALGPKAQQELTAPHFTECSVEILKGAGHLAPLERPDEVVFRTVLFLRGVGLPLEQPASLSQAFRDILASHQTLPQTRSAMIHRLTTTNTQELFDREHSVTLLALITCVLPSASISIFDRLVQSLTTNASDGWRFDALPNDASAWQHGLETLDLAAVNSHGVSFAALPQHLQVELLEHAKQGELGKGFLGTLHLGPAATNLTAKQMKQWFEDVRGELGKLYASDPRTMDCVGFHGFANRDGFTTVDLLGTERIGA